MSPDQHKIYHFLLENPGKLFTSKQLTKETKVQHSARKVNSLINYTDIRAFNMYGFNKSSGRSPTLYGIPNDEGTFNTTEKIRRKIECQI